MLFKEKLAFLPGNTSVLYARHRRCYEPTGFQAPICFSRAHGRDCCDGLYLVRQIGLVGKTLQKNLPELQIVFMCYVAAFVDVFNANCNVELNVFEIKITK